MILNHFTSYHKLFVSCQILYDIDIFDIKDYPKAYAKYMNEITLPLHTLLSDEDVDYVIESFKNSVQEVMTDVD